MKFFQGAMLAGVASVSAFGVAQFFIPAVTSIEYDQSVAAVAALDRDPVMPEGMAQEAPVVTDERPIVAHVPLPAQQKIIYMTSCVVGTPSLRDGLVRFIDESEINSVIIDIKDFSGTLSYDPVDTSWDAAWIEARCGSRDMKAFVEELHRKDIFVIARITVFQDPFYTARNPVAAVKKASDGASWKDHKGLSFIDVGYEPYWDHLVDLSVDVYNLGFDELNFDYIRYPSDGNMKDIAFPHSEGTKQEQLETFFAYLHSELAKPEKYDAVRHENTGRETNVPYLSADLFGMTTSNTDDLSIGQVLERALPYFDFVAPMVYPSHYPDGFLGLADPNLHVYTVVNYAMESAVRRALSTTTPNDAFVHERIGTSTPARYSKPAYAPTKLRTWIQDFDYGGNYDVAEVRAQIQASYDAGVTSWMVWDPANRYTRGAYNPE